MTPKLCLQCHQEHLGETRCLRRNMTCADCEDWRDSPRTFGDCCRVAQKCDCAGRFHTKDDCHPFHKNRLHPSTIRIIKELKEKQAEEIRQAKQAEELQQAKQTQVDNATGSSIFPDANDVNQGLHNENSSVPPARPTSWTTISTSRSAITRIVCTECRQYREDNSLSEGCVYSDVRVMMPQSAEISTLRHLVSVRLQSSIFLVSLSLLAVQLVTFPRQPKHSWITMRPLSIQVLKEWHVVLANSTVWKTALSQVTRVDLLLWDVNVKVVVGS